MTPRCPYCKMDQDDCTCSIYASVPEGWKLVPIEPTAAMVFAFDKAFESGAIHAETYYSDMIAAAPTPPVSDKKDRIIASLQAKIDELMLEYCPDEMTPEQLAYYEKHQLALTVSEVMLDSFEACGEAVPEDDRKDAARYRFLRKDWFREDDAYSWLMSRECGFLESPDELDAEIDRNIKLLESEVLK